MSFRGCDLEVGTLKFCWIFVLQLWGVGEDRAFLPGVNLATDMEVAWKYLLWVRGTFGLESVRVIYFTFIKRHFFGLW